MNSSRDHMTAQEHADGSSAQREAARKARRSQLEDELSSLRHRAELHRELEATVRTYLYDQADHDREALGFGSEALRSLDESRNEHFASIGSLFEQVQQGFEHESARIRKELESLEGDDR